LDVRKAERQTQRAFQASRPFVPFFEEAFNEDRRDCPENVLAGFDFPHPEGLADSRSFFEDLSDQPAEVVRPIMSDNMRDLLNL
jgi:hypothetical protein